MQLVKDVRTSDQDGTSRAPFGSFLSFPIGSWGAPSVQWGNSAYPGWVGFTQNKLEGATGEKEVCAPPDDYYIY